MSIESDLFAPLEKLMAQDLPKTGQIVINDRIAEDFIPVIQELEQNLPLRCYQRDIDDPDDIRLCYQCGGVNFQFWKPNGKPYTIFISAIKGELIIFKLRADVINGIDESSLVWLLTSLIEDCSLALPEKPKPLPPRKPNVDTGNGGSPFSLSGEPSFVLAQNNESDENK